MKGSRCAKVIRRLWFRMTRRILDLLIEECGGRTGFEEDEIV